MDMDMWTWTWTWGADLYASGELLKRLNARLRFGLSGLGLLADPRELALQLVARRAHRRILRLQP